MKKTGILILTLLLLASTAQANFTIQNPTITIDLVAGSSITRNITFRYTGRSTQPLAVETTITPDGDGIEVTYSDIPTTVSPNTDYTIKMKIVSSFYLKPGEYIITTKLSSSETPTGGEPAQRATIIVPHGESGVEYYPTPPPDDPYNPPQPQSSPYKSGFNWLLAIAVIIGVIITLLALFLRRRKHKGEKQP